MDRRGVQRLAQHLSSATSATVILPISLKSMECRSCGMAKSDACPRPTTILSNSVARVMICAQCGASAPVDLGPVRREVDDLAATAFPEDAAWRGQSHGGRIVGQVQLASVKLAKLGGVSNQSALGQGVHAGPSGRPLRERTHLAGRSKMEAGSRVTASQRPAPQAASRAAASPSHEARARASGRSARRSAAQQLAHCAATLWRSLPDMCSSKPKSTTTRSAGAAAAASTLARCAAAAASRALNQAERSAYGPVASPAQKQRHRIF